MFKCCLWLTPFLLLMLHCSGPVRTPVTEQSRSVEKSAVSISGKPAPVDIIPLLKLLGKSDTSSFVKDSFQLDNISVVTLTRNDDRSYVFIYKQRWQLLDSLEDRLNFWLEDANGDHIPDVMANGYPDIHGMSSSYIYLYRADSFVRVSMPGRVCAAKYDSVGGVLRSYYISGARGIHNKEEYLWKDDHLFLFRGVEMDMTGEKEVITTWYHAAGNKIVNDRKRKGGAFYDTALWPLYNP